MERLVDTTEMFLKIIYELHGEGIAVRQVRIAERLHQTQPAAHQTLARLERDGLIITDYDRQISLTESGHARAVSVMRKHLLAECLLARTIGLDLRRVHAEACRWEHVMSDEAEREIDRILEHPTASPFGIPIPDLSQIDRSPEISTDKSQRTTATTRLNEYARKGGGRAEVREIGEHVQSQDSLIAQLLTSGVMIGKTIKVDSILRIRQPTPVWSDSERINIPSEFAHSILVVHSEG